jgi:hypothetical protein
MNEVNSYIFKSPYHSQTQIGYPDPVAKAQEKQQETQRQLETINDTQRELKPDYAGFSKSYEGNVFTADKVTIDSINNFKTIQNSLKSY